MTETADKPTPAPTQPNETQTIATLPPSTDLVVLPEQTPIPPTTPPEQAFLECFASVWPDAPFSVVIEAPTTFVVNDPRKTFKPMRLEIRTITDAPNAADAIDDLEIFGLYVDRLPNLVGTQPIPASAFAANQVGGEAPMVTVTPFSLIEVVGMYRGSQPMRVAFRLRGPVLTREQIEAEYASASVDWFAASHAYALKQTLALK